MYDEKTYQLAKAQLAKIPKTDPGYETVSKRVAEYEAAQPGAFLGIDMTPPSKQAAEPKLPHESPPVDASLAAHGLPEAETRLDTEDRTADDTLPNASKLKTLNAPTEYVSTQPHANLTHVLVATAKDPLDGPLVNSYYEPSEEAFRKEQGPALAAQGIHGPQGQGLHEGSDPYYEKFNEWKDRKWIQAYNKAKAEDRPLTRMEYVKNSGAWDTLKNTLANVADSSGAFIKGLASGRTLHVSQMASGVSDAIGGGNESERDAEQAARNPAASFLGDLKGSSAVAGPLAKLTNGATESAAARLPGSMLGRIGSAAVGGAAAGAADLAGRTAGELSGNLAHEPSSDALRTAKDRFVSGLLGSSLVGAGFGAGGHLLAEGANAMQKSTLANYPEVGQLRRGGGDTDLLFGVKPGKEVAGNIEAAREPLPGENKPIPAGNATEIAAKKVQGPLTETNAAAHSDLHAQIGAERDAAIEADPRLQRPVPARKTANAAVDWVLSKLQPEARANFLPGGRVMPKNAAPAADTREAQELAQRLWKPRLVTSVEAATEARQAGGKVVSIEDAEKLGVNIGDLHHEPAPDTGVPLDAPEIPDAADEPFGVTTEEVFGRPADRLEPSQIDRLKPREGRAKPPLAQPVGSDWDEPEWQRAKFDLAYHEMATPDPFPPGTPKAGPDDATRPSNSPPIPVPPSLRSFGRPAGPPPELRATPTPAASQAQAAGLPSSELKVVLEPREYNARELEEIIGDVDRKAKAGSATAKPDPAWKNMQRAIREDREQFGSKWTDMIERHHEQLNGVEQRSYHAGMVEKAPYSEMQGASQQALNGKLVDFPGGAESSAALRSLADAASPGVRKDLEVLGAQGAFAKLKGQAMPKIGETLGSGGMAGHLRGLGPAVKLRADALSRGISAGPTGEPTITPRLAQFIAENGPRTKRGLPFSPFPSLASGGGALGMKASVTYNSLTPEQRAWLQKLADAMTKTKEQAGVAQ